MIFESVEFYKESVVSTDELGNEVMEDVFCGAYPSKIIDWTEADVAVEGRDFTSSHRLMITKAPQEVVKDSKRVICEGDKYTITNTSKSPRWQILHLKRWRA